MNARTLGAAALLPIMLGTGHALAQATVSAAIVYKEGDLVAGLPISSLNSPFTDGNGRMASLVTLNGVARAIVDEHLVVLFNSGAVVSPALTGGEGTIGFSNANGYIYSPSIDGQDGVFSDGGTLLRGTSVPPGFPALFTTFNSRPTMTPDGTAYWVAGTAVTSGGATSQRVLYMNATPANPAATSIVLKGGDTYGGLTLAAQGIAFDYGISDNGLHRIHGLTATGVSTANDVYLAADDVLIAQEGMPAPVGNWTTTLRIPSINNSGQWVFAGDTSGPAAGDEVLKASTGQTIIEGAVIGGVTLTSTCNAVSINNLGDVAFVWGTGGTEVLCRGPVATLSTSAVKLLQVNDLIDIDGDNGGDYTIIDFEASAAIGPGLDLGDDGRVFVEVTIRPVGGTSADDVEAIVRLPGDSVGGGACNLADITNVGDTGGGPDGQLTYDDILLFINTFGDGAGCPGAVPCSVADITNVGDTGSGPDGQLTYDDLLLYINTFGEGC